VLSCCGNYTFKYDVPGYPRTMCITDWLEKLWMSYLCCANLRQTEGSRMSPGWGSHGTWPGLRVERCTFWGKAALTDLHVFFHGACHMKEDLAGSKSVVPFETILRILFHDLSWGDGLCLGSLCLLPFKQVYQERQKGFTNSRARSD